MGAPDPRVPGWKAKVADGTITPEEYAEMVAWMRGERRTAEALVKVKKAKKAKKTEGEDVTD